MSPCDVLQEQVSSLQVQFSATAGCKKVARTATSSRKPRQRNKLFIAYQLRVISFIESKIAIQSKIAIMISSKSTATYMVVDCSL